MALKTALIGCGKVAHFHARAFQAVDSSVFCAVYDRKIERAREFAAVYGVRAYDDIAEMVKKEGIQLISICTPHPAHASMAVEAANNGCHILVEKPLASNLKDCDLILSAATNNNITVGTVCQRRFYSPCLRIKKAIDEGKIGKPMLGIVTMLGWRDQQYYESDPWRGTWEGEGGGVLVNQAPHQLDLLLWYMGDIEEVYGIWKNINHPYIEVDDTALAIIKFKNGGLGQVVVSNSQNPALYGKVQIHGDSGASVSVQTDGGAMFIAGVSTITEPPYNDIWTIKGEEQNLQVWQEMDRSEFEDSDSIYKYHQIQIEDFINSIIENRKPLIDGLAGRKTVELIEAIYLSSKTGLPVKFPFNR